MPRRARAEALNPVALFTRAWIEILYNGLIISADAVALFTRAWIEILSHRCTFLKAPVALFTRAWIEIKYQSLAEGLTAGRPLHEGVD